MAFSLDLPSKEEIKQAVEAETAVEPEVKLIISDTSAVKGSEIVNADLTNFEEVKSFTSAIEEFGTDVVKQSAKKNEIMKTRLNELSRAGGESGAVAKGLEDLSAQMKDLDPSAVDFMKSGPLSKLFNPVRSYFNKYQTADAAIAQIISSLETGARVLTDDNTTLEIEQASMRDLTRQLNQKIALGQELDDYLTSQITKLRTENADPDRIRFVEEDILFPLRQRLIDFNQMLAVNQNGIIAMEIIRKNNLELIRSVRRAQTVTVSALTVAVTVAGALYNQKVVLEKVQVLNQTTNNMIASTSSMLKNQGIAIQKQAVESNIDVETLKKAFAETLEALDDISRYKQAALPQMRSTIEEFRTLADEGEKAINRIEKSRPLVAPINNENKEQK
ncbi:MAG: toxic anion resistance protein [Eubacteriales bacterium]|nr:toxic anion resistance protein [Eubacteriales bacterium]